MGRRAAGARFADCRRSSSAVAFLMCEPAPTAHRSERVTASGTSTGSARLSVSAAKLMHSRSAR
eukprot:6763490-Prymnesium_polylepis.1